MAKKVGLKEEKIVKEIKKEDKKKSYIIKEVDVIIPSRFVDWSYFTSNIKSWFEELPIRKLYFGCNVKDDDEFYSEIQEFLKEYPQVEFVDQRNIKTLGACIVDLMKRVETKWFVYLHTDVFITPHSFLVLEVDTEDDIGMIGMIESERVSTDYEKKFNYPTVYSHYHYIDRAFSGYQLIQKKAIESILSRIEDDYVYRNEDVIFQNICENNGFKYIKSWAMHIHTSAPISLKWAPQGTSVSTEEAQKQMFDMQVKGLVKYCTPSKKAVEAWGSAFGACSKLNGTDLFEFIEDFVRKVNPDWEKSIKDYIINLLRFFVWK